MCRYIGKFLIKYEPKEEAGGGAVDLVISEISQSWLFYGTDHCRENPHYADSGK